MDLYWGSIQQRQSRWSPTYGFQFNKVHDQGTIGKTDTYESTIFSSYQAPGSSRRCGTKVGPFDCFNSKWLVERPYWKESDILEQHILGKAIVYFEEEIGRFLLTWFPEIVRMGRTEDYLFLIDNIIHFNAAYLDEEMINGFIA